MINNNYLPFSVLAASLVALGAAPVAVAQTEDSVFEEVIVTATKRAENIYDVPMAVSAFTEDTIFKQGITDLTDIGKFVPNMTVTGFSAGHTSSVNVFLRGIGLQDHLITTDPGVGVYVDGVYLGRQVGQNWSLSNIERVEVLRGPQGTLYGRNSIGGAINIITNKPGDENGGRVTLTVGSRGRLNGDFYWNTRLSDNFAASFTGSYMSRDGVGDFLNFDAGVGVGEMEEWAGRIAAKWDPTEDLSVMFTYDKNDGEGGLRPYTTLIDEVPTGLLYGTGARNSDVSADPYDNAGAFYFDSNGNLVSQANVSNEADGWSITADWHMTENLSWKLIYSDRSSEYTSGLDDDSIGFIGASADPTDPTLGVLFQYPETGFADQTSAELQLFGDFGNWDFVAGLYFFEEEGGNDQNPNFFVGGLGRHLNFQDAESKAIYANVGFQATDRLRLSVGARHTQDDKFAFTDIGALQESNSRDWDETSWEIAAAWDMNDRMNLYGTIQNGYQSGQYPPRPFCLFDSFDFGTGILSRPNCYVANDNVTAINYEVGLKGRPVDRLSMSVAVFTTDYSDLPYQVSDNTGGGFNTVNIIVDQTSTGVEWESSWAPTDQFMLHTAIGFIDVDVDNPNPRIAAPLTPELTAAISPEYTQSLQGGAEIVWRLDWSYRDEMFGQPFNDVPITDIDSRTLINFDIAYHSPDGGWTLAAYGRNVTDEKYDNARLLPIDYVLQILNNDRSEFGLRFVRNF
ncbi:MAG: TonB-dependent receptor [Proteobacteria bacterium]|nr:TonB-dependent receptor [Pseudomonadota bacterium]